MNDEVYVEPGGVRPPAFLFRRISWGAIFAGLFITIMVQLMFSVLGVAIGASVTTPWSQPNGARLAFGAELWLLVTGLVSLFIGAFVAGRLSGGPRLLDGMLHGLVTWSVSTLVMVILLATATGAVIGGLGTLVGRALSGPGQIRISLNNQQTSGADTNSLSPTGREGAQNPANEPNQNESASGVSNSFLSTAWWGFIALILGFFVAAWGGWVGTASLPARVEVRPAA